MKIYTEVSNQGIRISVGDRELKRLTPSSDALQDTPRRCYVYAHYDEPGVPFYVGKGTARRAWDEARHPLWHRFVNGRLRGKYTIRILADDLSAEEAEELESRWIAQESETLVNWINIGRKTDFEALDRFHALRDANRSLIAAARALERDDPERAIADYRLAVKNIAAYATLRTESGLLGQLIDEEKQERGLAGELAAIDRLTLCLCRTGRLHEAREAAEAYFAVYRADAELRASAAIFKRLSRAPRQGQDQIMIRSTSSSDT